MVDAPSASSAKLEVTDSNVVAKSESSDSNHVADGATEKESSLTTIVEGSDTPIILNANSSTAGCALPQIQTDVPASPTPQIQSKKRKLQTNAPPDNAQHMASAPSPAPLARPSAVTQLMVDFPIVQQTVRNMLALLESYGPLTAGQLEYNLPIVSGERLTPRSLNEILEILVCVGVVQKVLEPTSCIQSSSLNSSSSQAAAPFQQRYCVCQGVPRADVVLPSSILDEIAEASRSAQRSYARSKILIDALKPDSTLSCKETLKKLLLGYPELAVDPVYVTAFKNCHVDVGSLERERRHGHKTTGSSAKEKSSSPIEPVDLLGQKNLTSSVVSVSTTPEHDSLTKDAEGDVVGNSVVTENTAKN